MIGFDCPAEERDASGERQHIISKVLHPITATDYDPVAEAEAILADAAAALVPA